MLRAVDGWLVDDASSSAASPQDFRRGIFEGVYTGAIEILSSCPDGTSVSRQVEDKTVVDCSYRDRVTNVSVLVFGLWSRIQVGVKRSNAGLLLRCLFHQHELWQHLFNPLQVGYLLTLCMFGAPLRLLS